MTGSCQPKKHIFFLKTHKTASSTIMNILFRFGDSRNLTFALPSMITHFSYANSFVASYVKDFSTEHNKTFHIMCHHMRFQLTEVEKVMPSDTFYFTIIRNPITLMESSFSYYKWTPSFSKAESLDDFLNNTTKYYINTSAYAKNLMAFDMGFDHNGRESAKHFKLMLDAVETMFDLVLITEYFDESLVLLMDALCWTFDDILSFPLNTRSNSSRKAISLENEDKIKAWNQFDWQLYVYFNRSFWDRVQKFGIKRMQHEVEELKSRRAHMSKTCLQDEVGTSNIVDNSLKPFQNGIATILGYNLKSGLATPEQKLCLSIVTPEIQYTNFLHKKQRDKN
ncbi:galactose-3-O-sulfotransferase 2-like [Pelodytes ibericus]